ncbi:Asp23/Gls24 family envelope stress response protein [Streptomyces antimycoticus]
MDGCAFCRQAVEGLIALDSTTRTLWAERPSARTVADGVMRAVRAEVRLGRMLPLDDPTRELRIAETAAARVLRRAADRVPGVRAASCRLTPDEGSTKVTLAVTLDHPLPDRATEVRRAVAHAAGHELGLAVSTIDLRIVSVLEPLEPLEPTASEEPTLRDGCGR